MNDSNSPPVRKSIGTEPNSGRISFVWYREPDEPKFAQIFEEILDSAGISNSITRAEARQAVRARIRDLQSGLLEYPEHVRDLTSNPSAGLFELRWSFPYLTQEGLLLRLYECEPSILGATVIGLHMHRKEIKPLGDSKIRTQQQAHIEYAVMRFHRGKSSNWGIK
jgi:hypothetical protein